MVRRRSIRALAAALAALLLGGVLRVASAHHNSQAEFGPFGGETVAVEGTIVGINWANPHISMDIEITGGAIPAGEKWRLVSHPIRIMEEYGFKQSDFAVGDHLKLLAWKHVRKQPLLWPRAIQVNDGPMRSNLRFTDMIDIAKGTFAAMHIEAPLNLNGSAPERAGAETVEKLKAMGLIDANGLMIWPPPSHAQ
jgi:Family of unknown function (DUF6152)